METMGYIFLFVQDHKIEKEVLSIHEWHWV